MNNRTRDHDEYVGKYMPSELDDCISLERYIYIGGSPLETLVRGGCADARGLATRGMVRPPMMARGKTLNKYMRHPGGPIMVWAKPHIGGGPRAQ
jgi:hypothetical protein